jgi:hypothetical protein
MEGNDEPMLKLDDLMEWHWSERKWAGSHSKDLNPLQEE